VGDDQRKAQLDQVITAYAGMGYRVETRSDFEATMVKVRRNRIRDLIRELVGSETRRVVTINADGTTSTVKGS
jgi:hypothetical protein